jgi:XRE family aerobic/anaerobic benzoate catabolism transcriptional regulator
VSERFLVQLEGGAANISVARLEDVAEGLGTTGAELLARASQPRSRRKPAETTRAVHALVGLRGAGKSAVGAAAAARMGIPFVELDEAIAREAQMTLATIFEIHGEAYFRTMEREVLLRLLDGGKPLVVATGGSIVTDVETWGLLRRRAHTIWLRATPKEHWDRVVAQGDVRPMRGRPRAMNELRQLLTARAPLYEQADVTIDTSGRDLEEVVDDVVGAEVGERVFGRGTTRRSIAPPGRNGAIVA